MRSAPWDCGLFKIARLLMIGSLPFASALFDVKEGLLREPRHGDC
jgi:hypothetical protein